MGTKRAQDILLVGFATLPVFTASGIMQTSIALSRTKPESTGGASAHRRRGYWPGLPSLFENAATSFRTKACSSFAFWLAAAIAAYWSFALGIVMIQVGLAV
jgi:hypothetical protein